MAGMALSRNTAAPAGIALRRPRVAHGPAIHELVAASKPLDLNSRYAYLLLAEHFSATCVIAEDEGGVAGFVSAYVPPGRDDTVFVWQVAAAARVRGRGVAHAMLREVLARPRTSGCAYLETTVSPSNEPSRRLFLGLARELGAPVQEIPLFAAEDFGDEDHECEVLIRIGPLPGRQPQGGASP